MTAPNKNLIKALNKKTASLEAVFL